MQDLDGDGDMDLAVTNFLWNNISLLLNQGSGAFVVAPNPLSSADGPIDVSASDLEGDGDYDLVLTGVSKGVGNMTLLRNRVAVFLNLGRYTQWPHFRGADCFLSCRGQYR